MESVFNNEEAFTLDKSSDSVVNIWARYNDIKELFPEEILKPETLTHFIYWLIAKVQLIEIVAYSDDEAYTIFETMNDRGLSLTPVDMLKGFILANITDSEKREEAAKIWKEQMLLLKTEISETAEQEFFRDWFRAKYAQTIRQSKAGAERQDFEKMAGEFHICKSLY